MSVVFAMLLGAQSIDGCDVLLGRTGRLLGHEPPRSAAPGPAASPNQRRRSGLGELFTCCMNNSPNPASSAPACPGLVDLFMPDVNNSPSLRGETALGDGVNLNCAQPT